MSILHRYKHRLLVVDIQKTYSRFYNLNYLLKVKRFLANHSFEDIRMLIDVFEEIYSGEFIPSFIDKSLTGEPIFKQYCTDFAMNLLEEEGIDVAEFKQELLNNHCILPFHDGLMALIEPSFIPDYKVCHSDNLQEYLLEYLPPAFKDYLHSCQGSKVHIIGGGYGECVYITKQILDLLNIRNCIHSNYCYEMNPYSSLSYPPLDKGTKEVNWSFKRNDFLF
ncbi:hypothetical protein [Desulfitobacterium sp. PCE1]|uniref:hypothetical protein n=1 Tax=Desulfitobacterium sp. PCE1 TaxID=146907 RepID=UPI00035DBDE9|nr:hypothetical protein [Desulfitobacterium sp. PCE1]